MRSKKIEVKMCAKVNELLFLIAKNITIIAFKTMDSDARSEESSLLVVLSAQCESSFIFDRAKRKSEKHCDDDTRSTIAETLPRDTLSDTST